MLLTVSGWEASLQGGCCQCQLPDPLASPALECLGLSREFPPVKRLMQMDTAQLQRVLESERLDNFHRFQNRFLSFKPLFAIRTAMQENGQSWGS